MKRALIIATLCLVGCSQEPTFTPVVDIFSDDVTPEQFVEEVHEANTSFESTTEDTRVLYQSSDEWYATFNGLEVLNMGDEQWSRSDGEWEASDVEVPVLQWEELDAVEYRGSGTQGHQFDIEIDDTDVTLWLDNNLHIVQAGDETRTNHGEDFDLESL